MTWLKKHAFIIALLLLLLIKQRLATMLPLLTIYDMGPYDDLLMVQSADSLFHGKWPGSSLLLTKGFGFPFFLIVSALSGIRYAALNTLFHSISCILLMYALKMFFQKKWEMLLFLFFLLFSPLCFQESTFQRIYRSSITIWQIQMIIASLTAMLLRLKGSYRTLFLWSLPGILSLPWFYHTREDAMWFIPFALGMLIVSFGFLIRNRMSWKDRLLRMIPVSLPLVFLLVSIEAISAVNYVRNGFWGTTFFNSRKFSGMVRTIYSIDLPDSQKLPPRIAISRAGVKTLYRYSHTMAEQKETIEKSLDHWSYGFQDPRYPKEVWNGWIFWAMMDWAGKTKAKEAMDFYSHVAHELRDAVQKGVLKTRAVMPLSLMAPWKPQAWPAFQDAMRNSLRKTLEWTPEYFYRGPVKDNMAGLRYMCRWTGAQTRHISDRKTSVCKLEDFSLKICEAWSKIYPYFIIPVEIGALIGFIFLLGYCVLHPQEEILQGLLFLSGLLASYFLLLLGVSYTDATGFFAVNNLYLNGAYPLILVFSFTAFFAAGQKILSRLFRFFGKKSFPEMPLKK